MNSPTPDKIKQARENACLTQLEAAVVVHVNGRTWQRYESGESAMPAAAWELFLIKTKKRG